MINQDQQHEKISTASLDEYYQDALIHIIVLIAFIGVFVKIISDFVTTMLPAYTGFLLVIFYIIIIRARAPKVKSEELPYSQQEEKSSAHGSTLKY